MINLVCTKIMFMAPRLFTVHSLTAAFVVLASDFIIAGLFAFLCVKLMPDEELDIIDLASKYLGRGMGIFVALCGVFVLLVKILSQTRICSSLITNQAYNITSPSFFNIALYLAAIIVAYLGLETISRLHAVFIPVSLATVVIITMMSLPNFNINFLFPIFGYGFDSIKNDVLVSLNCFTDWFVILLILPNIRRKKLFCSSVTISYVVSICITAFITIMFCGISSGATKNDVSSPVLLLVQLAKVAGHVFRLDVFLLIVWNFFALLYTCAILFFCAICIKKAFSLSDHRPITLPLGVCVFAVSVFTEEHPLIQYIYYYSHIICEIFGFLAPVIVLILISAKRRSVKKA